jgi:outer membrane protein TolC
VSALDDPMLAASIDHLPFGMPGIDGSLTIEQRFPLGRTLGHRERVAEFEAARLRADASRVELDVELEAVAAFLMLHERRQMLAIIERQRTLAEQLIVVANGRYAAASGAQADVFRAETEMARLDGEWRGVQADVRAAEVMLNASLGRAVDSAIPPLRSPARMSPPPSLAAVLGQALQHRPELRAGRAEINRAGADVAVMDSMYAPMGMVRAGPAYTMAEGIGAMIMVGVSLPIWRERLDGGVAEAQAMAAMARADLSAMRRMIEAEAATTREQVAGWRERCLALQGEVIPRAERAIDPSLAAYAAGQAPLVAVIEAVQALWSAQAELVSAEFNLGMAWARLDRALGREGQTS